VSCRVGNDTNNSACQTNIKNTSNCNIDTDTSVALVSSDEDGEITASCATKDGTSAHITLDCGNGKTYEDDGSILEKTCRYKEKNI
jgi:hypothetical protein